VPRRFQYDPGARDPDADVRREIESHLQERAREFMARGMGPEEARRAALDAFGDRDRIEAEVKTLRGVTVRGHRRRRWWGELRQDVGITIRSLQRSPLFATVALLTVALGIGANTAVFTVLRSVLLQPLPYPDAGRLVQVWTDHRALGRSEPEWLSPPQLEAYRSQNRSFAGIAGYQGWNPSLTGEGTPERLSGAAVTAEFLEVLGVLPAAGRDFSPVDDDANAAPRVILTDALWQRRFGGDRSVIGRSIELDGGAWTVIGVLPPEFRSPTSFPVELIRPMRRPSASGCRHGCIVLRAIGRMGPGITVSQAQQELEAITRRLDAEAPEENRGVGSWLVPLHEQVTGPVAPALLALFGAVGFVLLIACANLASLLLVRAGARAREFGIRAALGAGRGRIVRQLLTESAVLALSGGLLGVLLGWSGTRLLVTMIPAGILRVQAVALDGIVLAFAIGASGLAALVFGLLPALHAARPDLMGTLRTANPQGSHRIGAVRRGLVATELAISVVLLVGAGLLLRTFVSLSTTDLGFRTSGVVTAGLNFAPARYPEFSRALVTLDVLLARLRAHPAIRAAEVSDITPLAPGGDQDMSVLVDGRLPPAGQRAPAIWYRSVTPGYLGLIQAELIAGRMFGPEDRAGGPVPAILTEESARRFWPGGNPVGRLLTTGPDPDDAQIMVVGLLRDLRHDGPREPIKAQLFAPITRVPSRFLTVLVEPARDVTSAMAALRVVVGEVDPAMPLGAISTFEERFAEVTALPRYFAATVSGFAGAAVLLTLIGVYGMMAYAVRMREREIGVRMALGAAPRTMLTWLMGEGARVTAAGLVLGIGAALLSSRVLRASLHGVGAADPATYLVVGAMLAAAALLACWIPARRARAVNPVEALRGD